MTLGCCVFLLVALRAAADVPQTMNHQGLVKVNGEAFTGNGLFRFAIVDPDSGINRWTNEGPPSEGGVGTVPGVAVSIAVTDGIYSVLLGDTGLANMTPIPSTVFNDNNVVLRIWFDDGVNGNQQLLPDHPLATAPYSFRDDTFTVNDLGQVGLGTTTPETELDVLSTSTSSSGRVRAANGNADTWVMLWSGSSNGSTDPAIIWSDDAAADVLRFISGDQDGSPATEWMRIDGSNGRVGIGTTSPDNRLDVEGSVAIGAAYSGTTAAPTNGLIVEGNVGIRTNAPTAALHIGGTAGVDGIRFPDGTLQTSAGVGGGDTTPDTIADDGTISDAEASDVLTIDNGLLYAPTTGNVGIGTATPANKLDVEGGAVIGASFSGTTVAPTNGLLVQGDVGINDPSPDARLDVVEVGATVARFERNVDDGTVIEIAQGGVTEGTISVSGLTVSYNAFTGSHCGWTEEHIARGTLVVMTGDNRRRTDDPGSEPTYGISPATRANDPQCLGAYLGLLEPSQPRSAENPHQVMAVGNGDMWVVDNGRDIEPGQYLISSDLKGHAMLDDVERFPVGHVIARAGEGVDWSKVSDSIEGRKHKRISVFFESFERGSAAGLGKIIEQQQMQIEELSRRLTELEAAKGGAQ
jgi:hypothetical protein